MSGFDEAIRGYQELGAKLVDDWAAYTSSVAKHVNSGTYTADTAVADAVAGVKLAGWSWFWIASEAVDAIAHVANDPTATAPEAIFSAEFQSPLAGAALAPAGDLVSIDGTTRIPVADLSVVPAQLEADATAFRVRVAPGHRNGLLYKGTVTATRGGPVPETASITVRLQIK